MDNETSKLYKGLRLTDNEKLKVTVREEDVLLLVVKNKKCLVACVVADKVVNRGTFISTMTRIWQPEGRISFKEVELNCFMVEFQGESEKNRVMQGRPRLFDNFLVCLKECGGESAPKDMQFDSEPF